MKIPLDNIEARVMGALLEKASTTPENYPLSLNSLTIACNQKTSRNPVTEYDESDVLKTLDTLRGKGLVRRVDQAGSRVPKFKHVIEEAWGLNKAISSIFCVLLLRGPQTLGQIRQRTDRLYPFESIDEVEEAIQTMKEREDFEPKDLVKCLPVLPGTKETRYTYAWDARELQTTTSHQPPLTNPSSSEISKLDELEKRISELEIRLCELENLFA